MKYTRSGIKMKKILLVYPNVYRNACNWKLCENGTKKARYDAGRICSAFGAWPSFRQRSGAGEGNGAAGQGESGPKNVRHGSCSGKDFFKWI